MESHRRGDLTEQIAITELKRRNIGVSTPVGDNERYDLVIERPDGELLRTQVKTGWLTDSTIRFKGVSQHTNSSGHVYEQYGSDVDCFLVYSYDTEQIYLVPGEEVGTSMELRVDSPDQETAQINWAKEYQFDTQWPPDNDNDEDTAVSVAISILQKEGVSVFTDHERDQAQIVLTADSADQLRTVRVETGWLVDGRIRFDATEAADVYLVYCEAVDQLYSVHSDDFDESISLRVDGATKRSNPATAYEFENNWPPAVDPAKEEPSITHRVRDRLEVDEYAAEILSGSDDRQTIVVRGGDATYRVRIEYAWVENGLLRFNSEIPADFYAIEHPNDRELYLIPDGAFEESISLRVAPPQKDDPRINYAEDFRFADRWPP